MYYVTRMKMGLVTMSNNHYEEASGVIQPLDFCRFFPFNFGNFVKYVLRAPYKGDELGDLNKALDYIKLAKQDLDTVYGFEYDLCYAGHLAACFDNKFLKAAFNTDDYRANFDAVIEMLEFETDLDVD